MCRFSYKSYLGPILFGTATVDKSCIVDVPRVQRAAPCVRGTSQPFLWPVNRIPLSFPRYKHSSCGSLASYKSESFIAALILVSLNADGALLHVTFWYHNLLWWLGIFSAVYAACRSFRTIKKQKCFQKSKDCITNTLFPRSLENSLPFIASARIIFGIVPF